MNNINAVKFLFAKKLLFLHLMRNKLIKYTILSLLYPVNFKTFTIFITYMQTAINALA